MMPTVLKIGVGSADVRLVNHNNWPRQALAWGNLTVRENVCLKFLSHNYLGTYVYVRYEGST